MASKTKPTSVPSQSVRGEALATPEQIQQRLAAEQPRRRKAIASPEVVVNFENAEGMSADARAECARWLRKRADHLENFGDDYVPGQKFRFPPEPI